MSVELEQDVMVILPQSISRLFDADGARQDEKRGVEPAEDLKENSLVRDDCFPRQAAGGGNLFNGLPRQQPSLDKSALHLVAAGVQAMSRVYVWHFLAQ